MSRYPGRFAPAPEPDRAQHAEDWRRLAEDALAALEHPAGEVEDLVRRACLGRQAWHFPLPGPEGAVCELLLVAAHRWGRLRGDDARAPIAPILRAAAEQTLSALAAAAAARAAAPHPQAAPLATSRLPYKED